MTLCKNVCDDGKIMITAKLFDDKHGDLPIAILSSTPVKFIGYLFSQPHLLYANNSSVTLFSESVLKYVRNKLENTAAMYIYFSTFSPRTFNWKLIS